MAVSVSSINGFQMTRLPVLATRLLPVSAFPKPPVPGIKELLDTGVSCGVPENYIRPLYERPCLSSVVADECQPPVIDLAGLFNCGREKVIEELGRASKEWGVFQLINHGVSQEATSKIWTDTDKFFKQPAVERMRYYKSRFGSPVGYITSSVQSDTRALHWKDTLTYQYNPGTVNGFAEGPTICREAALEYAEEIRCLSGKLYAAFSESLGLKSDTLFKATGENSGLHMYMHYYPLCPDPNLTLGMSEHSDIVTFTVLLQDEVGGLQILKDDKWIDVKPIPGALTINLGDQLQILTNGKYKSVEHRVVTNAKKSRMSIPCFFAPSQDATISPLPSCIDENNPRLYKETVFRDYLRNYLSRTGVARKSNLDFARISVH